jgi:hypothetical protein
MDTDINPGVQSLDIRGGPRIGQEEGVSAQGRNILTLPLVLFTLNPQPTGWYYSHCREPFPD